MIFIDPGARDVLLLLPQCCRPAAPLNELKQLCLCTGIDIWEVIEAAATKLAQRHPRHPILLKSYAAKTPHLLILSRGILCRIESLLSLLRPLHSSASSPALWHRINLSRNPRQCHATANRGAGRQAICRPIELTVDLSDARRPGRKGTRGDSCRARRQRDGAALSRVAPWRS